MIFLSNENLEQITTIFGEYMHDKYNVNVSTFDDVADVTLKMMRMVAGGAQGVESIKELNIQVLGQLRRYYLARIQPSTGGSKTGGLNAVPIRDKEVFGNRQVVFKDVMPVDTSNDKRVVDLSKKLETLEARRNAEFAVPRPPEPDQGMKETAENSEDFLARVKELEKERETNIPVPVSEVKSIEYLGSGVGAKRASVVGGTSGGLPTVNVNRNLRVAKDNLVSLNEGTYYVKCISIKYDTDDFDHIITIKLSPSEAPVVFKMTDYSLVGDRVTVMYEPVLLNDKVVIDPGFVRPSNWLGFTLVVLKAPGI